PERGQRRVAPADRRLAREDGPEAVLVSEVLELGARVGDCREHRGAPAGPRQEVVGVRTRLEGRPGLRGGEEERPPEIEFLVVRPARARVRRGEAVEPGAAEAAPRPLRRERRAAHPAQDDVVGLVVERFGETANVVELLLDAYRLVEPAEPLRLAAVRPDGGI